MKITVLAYLEKDAETPDVVVNQVAEALAARGHAVTTLTIQSDVIALIDGLKKAKPDIVFNLVEAFGDDIIGGLMGVAGVLDLLEIPYTGGGPGELYLQEDKALAKKLLSYENVLYPHFAAFTPTADFETGGRLRMPLFVKPMRMDASLGIDERSLVRNTQELMEKVLSIHKAYGDAALAEEYIEGRELYVGVIGNQAPRAFPPIEIDFSGMPDGAPRVMDNKAKFDESSAQFKGTRAKLAELDAELTAKLQQVAIAAYRAIRVRDYGRVDLRLTQSGEIYVIEVNASCYLERSSEFATAAAADGLDYPALIDSIVELAIERGKHRRDATRRRKRTAKKAAKE